MYSIQRDRWKVLRELTAVVVASEYMREVYVQHEIAEEDVHVLPPPAELAPDPTEPIPRESRSRVLFVGRLTSGKGGLRAVQVVAQCQRMLGRPLYLTVAGEGPQLASCKQLAAELGVQAEFPGWVGPKQRLELLRAADVLIVPSLWPEPFGIVGIEAASVGLPAVAYRAGGIVDWLRPGESGELADGTAFGAQALASALERALRDAEHYRHLQLGAWRIAHEFLGTRHLHDLEKLFVEIARRPALGDSAPPELVS
jgi:glycosyltransferase involved in cell wall biosynthesis